MRKGIITAVLTIATLALAACGGISVGVKGGVVPPSLKGIYEVKDAGTNSKFIIDVDENNNADVYMYEMYELADQLVGSANVKINVFQNQDSISYVLSVAVGEIQLDIDITVGLTGVISELNISVDGILLEGASVAKQEKIGTVDMEAEEIDLIECGDECIPVGEINLPEGLAYDDDTGEIIEEPQPICGTPGLEQDPPHDGGSDGSELPPQQGTGDATAPQM